MHRPVAFGRIAASAAAGIAAALVAAPTAAPAGAGARAGGDIAAMERVVNAARRTHGLPPLRASARLRRSAALRASAIRRCGEFSHSPCGQAFAAPFAAAGYLRGSAAVAENLAWGTSVLGGTGHTVGAWLRSPPHRANLLARRWRDVGVATIRVPRLLGNSDVIVWVLQFGRRA